MPNRVQRERDTERRQEMMDIGARDSNLLHRGMNKSEDSKQKRSHKQANLSTGLRDGTPGGSTSRGTTSTSGSKRHASAGAGPGEPTATTAKREGKRATITRTETGKKAVKIEAPTRRNDLDTQVMPKPMRGSRTKSKPTT
jgi:hypothetical protein